MRIRNVITLAAAVADAAKFPANSPVVHYMGPEKGPFKCGNCKFFGGDNKPCAKVSSPVRENGCCNLFDR